MSTGENMDQDYGDVFLDMMKAVYEVLLRLAPPDSAITISVRASVPESADVFECIVTDDTERERVCRLLRDPELADVDSDTAMGIVRRVGKTIH
jgi:hypothetical protein